jgi:hypothetical protein
MICSIVQVCIVTCKRSLIRKRERSFLGQLVYIDESIAVMIAKGHNSKITTFNTGSDSAYKPFFRKSIQIKAYIQHPPLPTPVTLNPVLIRLVAFSPFSLDEESKVQ